MAYPGLIFARSRECRNRATAGTDDLPSSSKVACQNRMREMAAYGKSWLSIELLPLLLAKVERELVITANLDPRVPQSRMSTKVKLLRED